MHTPFGSALDFIPDKMLEPDARYQMLDQSQSNHNAKFDSSMPASVRLRRHYLPSSPRSSLLCLFRSSLLVSIDTTSTLSLSLQLPQLRRHSFPSLPLSLLRSSFFVSIVQTSTSFLISHLLSHSTPASEVSEFFP